MLMISFRQFSFRKNESVPSHKEQHNSLFAIHTELELLSVTATPRRDLLRKRFLLKTALQLQMGRMLEPEKKNKKKRKRKRKVYHQASFLKCSQSAPSAWKQRDKNMTLQRLLLPARGVHHRDGLSAEEMCVPAQNFFHLKSEMPEVHLRAGRDYFGSLC